MENDINALYDHLFNTLEALQDQDHPMEIERAKTIADVAQVAINAAKIEVEHARITGNKDHIEFMSTTVPIISPAARNEDSTLPTANGVKIVHNNVTTHRMR